MRNSVTNMGWGRMNSPTIRFGPFFDSRNWVTKIKAQMIIAVRGHKHTNNHVYSVLVGTEDSLQWDKRHRLNGKFDNHGWFLTRRNPPKEPTDG